MRLLLCGGGTAGHINPAIAVAQQIKKQIPSSTLLFVGREGGQENRLVTDAGFEVKTLQVEGLKRSLCTDNIRRIITAIRARSTAEQIIKEFMPDVVLGTGGYVCWPVISAAVKLGIPCAIHESNVTPGMTTKMLAPKCTKVFLNHERTAEYLSQRTKCTRVGNPILQGFEKIERSSARQRLGIKEGEFFILSFGGSIGASRINQVITEVMDGLSSKTPTIKHLHATGKKYYRPEEKRYMGAGYRGCKILSYINNMPTAMKAADLVICRSGAMTISELEAVGVAAILIPSPNVTGNHQFKNAAYLAERDAAILIEEKDLTSQILIDSINRLIIDENGRKSKAKNVKELFVPDSAQMIVNELISMK